MNEDYVRVRCNKCGVEATLAYKSFLPVPCYRKASCDGTMVPIYRETQRQWETLDDLFAEANEIYPPDELPVPEEAVQEFDGAQEEYDKAYHNEMDRIRIQRIYRHDALRRQAKGDYTAQLPPVPPPPPSFDARLGILLSAATVLMVIGLVGTIAWAYLALIRPALNP